MRIIKLGIISAVVFFLLITLMSLLVPSKVRISKAVDLSGDRMQLLASIKDVQQWPQWHPAFEKGIAANQSLTVVGNTDTSFTVVIQNKKGRSVLNTWQLHHLGNDNSHTLQWTMDFNLSWLPWHKFSSLFYEGTYGRMMQQGLNNLKSLDSSVAKIYN